MGGSALSNSVNVMLLWLVVGVCWSEFKPDMTNPPPTYQEMCSLGCLCLVDIRDILLCNSLIVNVDL